MQIPLWWRLALLVIVGGACLVAGRNYGACRRTGFDGWYCVTHHLVR